MRRDIHDLLETHPFFADMDAGTRRLICGCGANAHFGAGDYLCREGEPASAFYAIRRGCVAVQVSPAGRGTVTLQTLEDGDILGWSWLVPPYRWIFDARAIEDTRAVRFDAECLRRKCEQDPAMGYDLMKRFLQVFVKRIETTRLQLLDVYGAAPSA